MRTAAPLLLEAEPFPPVEPPPVEAPPVDGARLINGKWIVKIDGHWPRWRQLVRRQIPTYRTHHDGGAESGYTARVEVAYEWGGDPAEVIQQLMEMSNMRPFDPRPESPLHDQLELAERSGFADLAGICDWPPRSNRGRLRTPCWASAGYRMACPLSSGLGER